MILDLARFTAVERPYWEELESVLGKFESDPELRMSLDQVQRLHYLYERCSADLARLDTFSTEPRLRQYLEALVSRAYSRIHETRTPLAWPRASPCSGPHSDGSPSATIRRRKQS